MKPFRNTLVANSSTLGQALKDRPTDKKLHNQIYDQTTADFDKLYGAETRQWFENLHKQGVQNV
jgi:hypothetical protein